jgi:2-keto-4-pentenoate hydratase
LLQDTIIEQLSAKTGNLIGWKVGASNEKALAALKLDEPFRGPLFSRHVIHIRKNSGPPVLKWKNMGSALIAIEVTNLLRSR